MLDTQCHKPTIEDGLGNWVYHIIITVMLLNIPNKRFS
jgi:hypothetical protein